MNASCHHNDIISHVRESDGCIQSNHDHMNGVAEMAGAFAKTFHMADWGSMLGILHDKGKERRSFQSYIRSITGIESTPTWHGEDKQHAYVGALIAKSMYKNGHPMLSYPIMGHHTGLCDYSDFVNKMQMEIPSEITLPSEYINLSFPQEIKEKIPDVQMLKRDMHHIVRMLFSCLVDADYLDTERFMNEAQFALRGRTESLSKLIVRLRNHLSMLRQNAPSTPINGIRDDIQKKCLEMSKSPRGIYSLTVPTGGGKTLSSMLWAMEHAIEHGMDRIIIAIPYTSIVTQTSQILSEIFGSENVLEHHSDFDDSKIEDPTLRRQIKLSTENWDYPIIVTTNVQLFQSMMSNKPSTCRKLHNIANSVVILDEVQTLPIEHLQPIVDSLQTYQRIFGTSVLLTTASQPALRGDICCGRGKAGLKGIDEITEIIPAEWELHQKLRRTEIKIDFNPISPDALVAALSSHKIVMCIVNTRKEAKSVFEQLPNEGIKIHLSRMMCSAHLKKSISFLKEKLKNPGTQTIRVVATQLIEAGVDIDFPIVYRQEAGLDSVLQAAGRCNREGKLAVGEVYVFRLEKKPKGSIGRAIDAWLDLTGDKQAPDTMVEYFVNRYSREECFDKAAVADLLYNQGEWMFETVSRDFKMINDDGAKSVVVNYQDSPMLIEQLRQEGCNYALLKKLSMYTVRVHQNDFKELVKYGLVEEVIEGIYYIPDRNQYNADTGLAIESHWLEEILIN